MGLLKLLTLGSLVALATSSDVSEHEHDTGHLMQGICPFHGDWKSLRHLCIREGRKKMNFKEAIHHCHDDHVDNGPFIQMMTVGKLRHVINRYANEETASAHNYTELDHYIQLRGRDGPFLINAIKGGDDKWREYPHGKEVHFHHFPEFRPEKGGYGDVLMWYPRTNSLKVVNNRKRADVLCYRPKLGACRTCREEKYRLWDCFDAGDCLEGMCYCDEGFRGTYCEVPPIKPGLSVFLVGHHIVDGAVRKPQVRLLDLHNKSSCVLPYYPDSINENPLGGFVNGRPLVCGGAKMGNQRDNNWCFAYDTHKDMWIPRQDMHEGRVGSTSGITLHNGHSFWAVGMEERDEEYPNRIFTSTEIFTKNNYWTWGPNVPVQLRKQCLLNINDCETAYIGQPDKANTGVEAWLYNWNTMTWRFWKRLPGMLNPTDGGTGANLQCELIYNPTDNHPILALNSYPFVIDTTQGSSCQFFDLITDSRLVYPDEVWYPEGAPINFPQWTYNTVMLKLDNYQLLFVRKTGPGLGLFSITEGMEIVDMTEFTDDFKSDVTNWVTVTSLMFTVDNHYVTCPEEIDSGQ